MPKVTQRRWSGASRTPDKRDGLVSGQEASVHLASQKAMREEVAVAAKGLQNIHDAVAEEKLELRELGTKKGQQLVAINVISKQLEDTKASVEALITESDKIKDSLKDEESQEKARLIATQTHLRITLAQIAEMQPIADELAKFIKEKAGARKDWLAEQTKLTKLRTTYETEREAIAKEKKELADTKKALDERAIYLRNYHEKLGGVASEAKQIVKQAKEVMDYMGIEYPLGEVEDLIADKK